MAGAVGRYELVRAIGRGGMAEVFLARRRGAAGIAKRLVVKRVRQDLTSDPRFAELFLREARVATALSHKNIVTVFDVGRDTDGLFLAMDYVDGPDLASLLAQARRSERLIEPILAAHIVSEVAAGLEYAHRLKDDDGQPVGLVHRDITPRNVLVSVDGEVKVTDFGVASVAGDESDKRRGTVPYMSPEQVCGGAIDARSDVFGMGLLLYEIVCGERAYRAGDSEALLEQARHARVPPADSCTSAELRSIIEQATRADPGDRFASAREMQLALAEFAVAERSRSKLTEPLDHRLAKLVGDLFPDWHGHTFDATLGVVGEAGTATLQSVAETVAGDDEPEPVKASSPRPALASLEPAQTAGGEIDAGPVPKTRTAMRPAPSRRSWSLPAALLIAVTLAGAGLWWWSSRGGDTAEHDERASSTSDPDAGPLAAVSYDAAPSTRPVFDAGPKAPTDAGRTAVRTPRSDASASKVVTAPGVLDLNVLPWAFVSIDGGTEQETPIRGLELSPGSHKVSIHNPVLERRREMTIQIRPGETSRYVVDLRQ